MNHKFHESEKKHEIYENHDFNFNWNDDMKHDFDLDQTH